MVSRRNERSQIPDAFNPDLLHDTDRLQGTIPSEDAENCWQRTTREPLQRRLPWTRLITYSLPIIAAVTPVALLLGFSSRLETKVRYNSCTPSGQFVLPFTASIWDFSRFFEITITFSGHRQYSCGWNMYSDPLEMCDSGYTFAGQGHRCGLGDTRWPGHASFACLIGVSSVQQDYCFTDGAWRGRLRHVCCHCVQIWNICFMDYACTAYHRTDAGTSDKPRSLGLSRNDYGDSVYHLRAVADLGSNWLRAALLHLDSNQCWLR